MISRQRPIIRTDTPSLCGAARSRFTSLLLSLALATVSHTAVAGLYKCKNAQGKVIYSDTPCSIQAAASPDEGRANAGSRPGPGDAGKLTEKQIRGLMTEYDTAAQRLDANAMLSLLSDDAMIEIYVRRAGGTGRRTFRKYEYAKFMRNALDNISDYASRRESMHIALAPSGMQAEVNSRISEGWRQSGQMLTMASDGQYLIELRAGKPRFVWVHVTSTGEPHAKQ
jgi:ketosteroid isomerase-like protein